MKKLSKKAKSDLIFWGILIPFMAYLFFTPSGENTRAWLMSFTLTSPKTTSNTNKKVTDDWQLTSTEGEEVWLSEFKKPTFINVWATWCPPCRAELPSIFELQKEYKDKVDFILISPDEPLQKLINFGNKKGYTSVFYTANGQTPNALSFTSYPTTFILDAQKNVVLESVGAHDWNSQKVHELLDKLIKDV